MSLPFDHIENLLRTMERLEEHQRRLLALPNPALETLRSFETLQASLMKSPVASIIEKLTNHHQVPLMSPSQRFLQAATAAIEHEKLDFTRAAAGTAISTIAFTAGLENSISKAILDLSSSPLASVTKQAQGGIKQIFDKLAAESDLTKLYSTILGTNRINVLEGVLTAVNNETFENLQRAEELGSEPRS